MSLRIKIHFTRKRTPPASITGAGITKQRQHRPRNPPKTQSSRLHALISGGADQTIELDYTAHQSPKQETSLLDGKGPMITPRPTDPSSTARSESSDHLGAQHNLEISLHAGIPGEADIDCEDGISDLELPSPAIEPVEPWWGPKVGCFDGPIVQIECMCPVGEGRCTKTNDKKEKEKKERKAKGKRGKGRKSTRLEKATSKQGRMISEAVDEDEEGSKWTETPFATAESRVMRRLEWWELLPCYSRPVPR